MGYSLQRMSHTRATLDKMQKDKLLIVFVVYLFMYYGAKCRTSEKCIVVQRRETRCKCSSNEIVDNFSRLEQKTNEQK